VVGIQVKVRGPHMLRFVSNVPEDWRRRVGEGGGKGALGSHPFDGGREKQKEVDAQGLHRGG
jgi:hypothetical protein